MERPAFDPPSILFAGPCAESVRAARDSHVRREPPAVAALDESGYLTLAGRADDCFKTSAGYLVNPGQIVHALTTHPRVTEAVVLPVRSPDGPVIGALVECEGAVDAGELRGEAARLLPAWLHPQVLAVTDRLPRLAGGKADREACQSILRHTRGWRDPG